MSYAAMASAPPSPEQRLKVLREFYNTLPPSTILSEALGFYEPRLLKTPLEAVPLIEHILTICVDTESYTMNTDQMTELGLVYISRKIAKSALPPGPHGWKLQEALKFLHFRIVEHAHLKSNRVDSHGPLGNRFGNTTFTSFSELRLILNDLMDQEIEMDDPSLKGCKRPVIIVGHALRHDTENTNKQGLEYDLDDNLTLVAKVDTQALARETGVWVPPVGMETNEIGLRVMIENLGFKHLDDHTACNDAARTMMCAIHMILPERLQQSDSPTMLAVAERVEARSKATSGAPYGTEHCCIRCAGRDHPVEACQADDVRCAACDRFDVGEDREANMTSHIETYCQHVAKFKAWLRRYLDARRKGKNLNAEIAAGPGSDSHPWSTWPATVGWPLKELSDAKYANNLIQYNRQWQQPAPFVHNIQAALGGIPVPSTGAWVLSSTGNSTASTPSTASSVVASAWMSDPSRSNGNQALVVTPSPRPEPITSTFPVPAAGHTVLMSESRGRGRAAARGSLGRGAPRGGTGAGCGAGGTGSRSDLSWDPTNVW